MVHKAQSLNYHPEVIMSGRRVNEQMPAFLASKLVKELILRGKTPTTCKCLVLGLTFKEDCPDMRNSKSLDLVSELKEFGLQIEVNDPMVSTYLDLDIQALKDLSTYDLVVLAVPHSDYLAMSLENLLKDDQSFVFDFKKALPKKNWVLSL